MVGLGVSEHKCNSVFRAGLHVGKRALTCTEVVSNIMNLIQYSISHVTQYLINAGFQIMTLSCSTETATGICVQPGQSHLVLFLPPSDFVEMVPCLGVNGKSPITPEQSHLQHEAVHL